LQIQEFQRSGSVRDVQKEENFFQGTLGRVGTFQAPRFDENSDATLEESTRRDGQIQEELRLLLIENGVLGNLSFISSIGRQESVELPHRDTFKWIFDNCKTSERRWDSFVDWLETGSGIYWINGKVGSGKSTLMKYISEDYRTKEALAEWAGATALETSGFFFWNSGDENQRSQEGLLRFLLFDILGRHRDLLPTILPDEWDAWTARATTLIGHQLPQNFPHLPPEPGPWTIERLKRAFGDLIHHLHLRGKVKLCLFIDGLDEYGGDHWDLIDLFQGLAKFPNLKLCLSSRPLLAFCTAFDTLPGLRLQDLTQGDIRHYVRCRLHCDQYKLSRRYSAEAQALEADIVAKAQGVFLWVKLVVASLAKGLSDFTRLSDLRRRVDHLPSDLEDLYAHMLERVADPFYREQYSQLFQIFQAARWTSHRGPTLLSLSWAEDEEPDLAETAPIQPISHDEILERCQIMDSRLKSICAGLLESVTTRFSSIAPDAKVVFLHRTVSDWISKPDVWANIQQHTTESDFSPNLCMLKSCVMQLKGFDSHLSALDMNVVTESLKYARAAEADLGRGFPKLLDQLDVVVSYHWRFSNANAHYDRNSSMSPKGGTAQTHTAKHAGSLSEFLAADAALPWRSADASVHIENLSLQPKSYQHQQRRRIAGDSSLFSISDNKEYCDDETIVSHSHRSEGAPEFVAKDGHLHHWSYSVEIPGMNAKSDANSFYALATNLGLSYYIAAKSLSGMIFDQDVNVHLLQHALSAESGGAPNPQSIRDIFESGTNPNLAYCGITPWHAVLTSAASHFTTQNNPISSSTWERSADAWADILEIFLQYGADPTTVTDHHPTLPGHPKLTPIAVIQMLPETLAARSTALGLLVSSSQETWERKAGSRRIREMTATGGNAGFDATSVDKSEDTKKARMTAAVGWLGWIVSWIPS